MRWREAFWSQQDKLKEESQRSKHHQWFLLFHVRATLLSLDPLLLPSLDFGFSILLQGSLQLSWPKPPPLQHSLMGRAQNNPLEG